MFEGVGQEAEKGLFRFLDHAKSKILCSFFYLFSKKTDERAFLKHST